MKFEESALSFSCGEEQLFGILAAPETPAQTAVVVIVGGPQYRVGSHRQFVLLARRLAAAGHAVLRFDYRGMGDSTGRQHNFEQVEADVAAAIGVVQQRLPSVRKVVLWGLCDGASAALLYCQRHADSRVQGLCLLNPWVRSSETLARTHAKHYYLDRIRQRAFWIKLLTGGVALSAVHGLVSNLRHLLRPRRPETASAQQNTTFQQAMMHGLAGFQGPVQIILSGDDYTAKEFVDHVQSDQAWKAALQKADLRMDTVDGADHTFSQRKHSDAVNELMLDWLAGHAPD